ncbi:hypothetical protein MKW98_015361 [Papaver atlanticum]|uniref:Protein kinase domain-containing protein n=1 Tax=Papaver atlanticum TaxID=357466 RepID=A0AAD4RY62_9MAGN|nr:hypothetical protein MKW98_015361 [Papaver atlanticum]
MKKLWFFFCLILLFGLGISDPIEDKQALLDFFNGIPHFRYLNWNQSSIVCNNWTGVTCNSDKSRVIALRLPGVGINGSIPPNTLSRLTALQILSLRSNRIRGAFPVDLLSLKNLSYLYLQFNQFSGPLPLDFSVWKNLTVVNLSYNGFNGSIPSSISNLTSLTYLNLANNLLSGEIPDLGLPNLQELSLANNKLTGSVPKSLQKFPNSSFLGNNILLSPSAAQSPGPLPSPKSKNGVKLRGAVLYGVIVGGSVVGLFAIVVLLLICCSKRKGGNGPSGKAQKGESSPDKPIQGGQDGNTKLVFFEGFNYAFDLEDLLRASAEVLGKGTFGTAYKAVLEDATTVVVKRLKEVGVGKRDFEQQMEIVGRVTHENIAQLRAYYYSKDEKLMVYDYYSQGSVSALLHGKRGGDRIPLDWDTRLRIAVGAARGIACIHSGNNGKLVHGNIKASNVFLNPQNYGCVADLGLSTLITSVPPTRATGYKAPEVNEIKKLSQASDIYSYGVLLLELLTGKSAIHSSSGGDEVIHLVRWVQSVVREEWTAEVFDMELMRYPNIEEEMVEMLQVAMTCVSRVPDQRPKITDVVKMVEDIRRIDTGNRPSTEGGSGVSTPYASTSAPTPQ